jgi:hypothetical protein
VEQVVAVRSQDVETQDFAGRIVHHSF